MKRLLLAAMLATLASPAAADSLNDNYLAQERATRACLLAGATNAPGTDAASAIAYTRSFCAPQIRRLHELRGQEIARNGPSDPEALAEARRQARFALDDEIARAILTFSNRTL